MKKINYSLLNIKNKWEENFLFLESQMLFRSLQNELIELARDIYEFCALSRSGTLKVNLTLRDL